MFKHKLQAKLIMLLASPQWHSEQLPPKDCLVDFGSSIRLGFAFIY